MRGPYTHHRRAPHTGTCERCKERALTARYKDNGTTFVRLGDEPGGHWLCQDCVSELEQKRLDVRAAIRKSLTP